MNEIIYVQAGDIKPNPNQPRRIFNEEALDELADSIRKYGVIQPLLVRKNGERYELIAGERRLRAALRAGLDFVPVLAKKMTDDDSAVVALIENLQREDLGFIEEAQGYENLIANHRMTQQEVARSVGKSQSTIANKLRILRLTESQRDVLRANSLTERHARALLKLDGEAERDGMIKRILKNEWNVRQTEEAIEKKRMGASGTLRKGTLKSVMNMRIYTNTIKRAFNEILKTGMKAEYEEKEKGGFYEVTIRIPLGK